MKYLLFIFLLAGFCGRGQMTAKPTTVENRPMVFAHPLDGGDIAKAQVQDSLIRLTDSLRKQLFLANYKIERVKYYLHIAIKHPNQTKFLASWISRAIK